MVIYFFSFFAFNYAFEDYGFLLIDENQCTYLFNCFVSSFENIENDRTIVPSFRKDHVMTLFILRTFWNMWYAVINKYIIKNINAAIIIGQFAELRSKRAEIEEDDKLNCFVCNIDRYTLDQYGGFIHHTSKEHNIWHYFYFIFTVSTKEPETLNGIESFILEKVNPIEFLAEKCSLWIFKRQMNSEDTSWLPQYRTKKLDNMGPQDIKETTLQSFERIEKKLERAKKIITKKILKVEDEEFE